MRPHDMKHLEQLYPVAIGDVMHLKMKEATYQGSWKRSGGRSAWFMLRRKIDRLLEMMKRPEAPDGFNPDDHRDSKVNLNSSEVNFLLDSYAAENVFAMIRKDPTGKDGSVLAEVRDLRRYLLLVEAEMVSRGVVDEPDTRQGHDLYSRVAHATGVHRNTVKEILLCAAYSGQDTFNATTGNPPQPDSGDIGDAMSDRCVPRFASRFDPMPDPTPPTAAQRFTSSPTQVGSDTHPFGENAPWLVGKSCLSTAAETDSERAALDGLYADHGAGWMKLVEHLTESERYTLTMVVMQNTSVASTLVAEALKCYVPVTGAKMHVIDLTRAPRDYRSAWPTLHMEYNGKERSLSPSWTHDLYAWDEAQTKWRIKPGFEYFTNKE
jgi:hypothetical protein